MWQFWKWNGRYIQGDLVSKHKTKTAAISKAKKELGNDVIFTESTWKKEEVIWIDSKTHTPMGIICKSTGAKRSRQGKKGV